uniref:ABC transporter permease n=1 Tax=Ascaris lumbricoides TaxID=6252 RepID=A0A0M3IQX5_ASCLU
MSWYSKIYIFVREYRKVHPFSGFFLYIALNALLLTQFIMIMYTSVTFSYYYLGKKRINLCIY